MVMKLTLGPGAPGKPGGPADPRGPWEQEIEISDEVSGTGVRGNSQELHGCKVNQASTDADLGSVLHFHS